MCWCRGTISNIRGFGAFCKLDGYLKDGLIHSSQIHEELVLSRDEDDADKIKAMGFYANRDDKVMSSDPWVHSALQELLALYPAARTASTQADSGWAQHIMCWPEQAGRR